MKDWKTVSDTEDGEITLFNMFTKLYDDDIYFTLQGHYQEYPKHIEEYLAYSKIK